MDNHAAGSCKPVIEHTIEIFNIKKGQAEMRNEMIDMGKTANRIYNSVLIAILSVLGNMVMFWIGR